MHPNVVTVLEGLLAIAAGARMTFGPDERRVFSEALVVLERRRYAAEDAAVCERIADLQAAHGLASGTS